MAVFIQVRIGIAAFCLLLASMLFAADEQKYVLNMQDADIKEVIDLVAKVSGKTFIIDPRVRGKVTIVSDNPMSESQIYETFLATLEVYGFSAVVAGDAVKIIGQADIKSAGIPVETEAGLGGEQIITRVFPIQNTSATELVPILRPLVAKYGHLAGIPSANVLIIADRATNIERMAEIIALLDQAGSKEVEVVNLEHAAVSGMLTLLNSLSSTGGAPASPNAARSSSDDVQLVGDERSNRIIVKGEKDARAKIIQLIKQLDTPSKDTNSSFKVVFLNYANAVQMADILKGISTQANDQPVAGALPRQKVTILADEQQNALIVSASPLELSQIENIILQLDIPREQVLIEAAIVEVNGSSDDAFGVQWATNPERLSDGVPFVASSSSVAGSDISSIASSVAATGAAGALSAISSGTTIGIADPFSNAPNFAAIIQAIESESNTNLLSTPSVMTLDNSEAFITVGSSVPFKTGGNGTTDNPFTIDREDVGTTLTVIPHIQKDGTIRLEVDQSVESLSGDIVEGAVDLITSKRQVKTEVLVNDGQTIILGGLISDRVTEYETRVPLLGRIPILGALFRSTSYEKVKTNLLIILRPSIVKDGLDAHRVKRLNGIWELRIQSLRGSSDLIQPTVDEIFEGIYLEGSAQNKEK